MPGDPGAGTSSYWVMPIVIQPQKFRDRVITELIYLLISAAMVSMMFRRLIWIISFITFWLFVCIKSFYLSLTVILTSHFSNITYFRQQQQQNKPMKFYLPTLKQLVIQLAKLQIYTLNLTTTFWHCQKKSHYFWTGVYMITQRTHDTIITSLLRRNDVATSTQKLILCWNTIFRAQVKHTGASWTPIRCGKGECYGV